MKSFVIAMFFLVALASPAQAMEPAQLLNVVDGDSLLVQHAQRSREVRLIGVDAPEGRQEYGAQARAAVLRLCYGRALKLEFDVDRVDRFDRLLAYVHCGGTMLNEALVSQGLALAIRVKPNVKYFQRFKRAEERAKAQRTGFWLRGGLKETPAQWRQRNKE